MSTLNNIESLNESYDMNDDLIDLSDLSHDKEYPKKRQKKSEKKLKKNDQEEENIDFLDSLLAYDFESHMKDSQLIKSKPKNKTSSLQKEKEQQNALVTHTEKKFENNEIVKIKFEVFLKPKRLRASFQKFLDEQILFDIEIAREKAIERMKGQRYVNFVGLENGKNGLLDEQSIIIPDKEVDSNKQRKCQIIDKIKIINLENEDEKEMTFEIEKNMKKIQKKSENSGPFRYSKAIDNSFLCFKRTKNIVFEMKLDNQYATSSTKRVNLLLNFSDFYLDYFSFCDYEIIEKIEIGQEEPTEHIMYANCIALRLSSFEKVSKMRKIVHPINLTSFNREKHISMKIDCLQIIHFIRIYLSKTVLGLEDVIGELPIEFLMKKSESQKHQENQLSSEFFEEEDDQQQQDFDLAPMTT